MDRRTTSLYRVKCAIIEEFWDKSTFTGDYAALMMKVFKQHITFLLGTLRQLWSWGQKEGMKINVIKKDVFLPWECAPIVQLPLHQTPWCCFPASVPQYTGFVSLHRFDFACQRPGVMWYMSHLTPWHQSHLAHFGCSTFSVTDLADNNLGKKI